MALMKKFSKWRMRRQIEKDKHIQDIISSEIFSLLGDLFPYQNPDNLVGRKGATIYREMVNNDAEIRGTLKEIVYSTLGSPWEITSSEKDDEQADEQTAFIKQNFLNLGGITSAGMSFQTMNGFLYEMIMEGLTTGYGIWDKVPRMGEENRIEIHVLKGKPPADYEFKADASGNLTGIEFMVHGQQVTIDPTEFVVFPWLNFYANWYGTSELRSLYSYHALNKIILKMAGIFTAKLAGGLWKGKYPVGQDDKRILLQKVLSNASSTGVLVIPDDVDVEIDKIASGEGDVFAKISDWLTKKIRRGLIGLSTTSEAGRTGDAAGQASRDESVKQPMIKFISDMVSEVINKQVIKPHINLIWLPGARKPPIFSMVPKKRQDVETNAKVGGMLWNLGFPISETYAREKCGWIPPEEGEDFVHITQIAQLRGAGGKGEATSAQIADGIGSLVDTQFSESPWYRNVAPVDSLLKQRMAQFAENKADPDQLWNGLDRIEEEYGSLIREQVQRIGEWMEKKLKTNYEKWKFNRNGINELTLPYLGKIQRLWIQMARSQWRYGINTAQDQIDKAKAMLFSESPADAAMRGFNAEIPDDYADYVGTHWGRNFTDKMSAAFTAAFKAGYDAGESMAQIMERFNGVWEDYGGTGKQPKWYEYNRMQRNTESTLFNKARYNAGQKNNVVIGYRYIEERDDRTTILCKSLGGQFWPKGDPRIGIYYPPNHHQCRSFMDYVFAWEAPVKWDPFPTADYLQPHADFGGRKAA